MSVELDHARTDIERIVYEIMRHKRLYYAGTPEISDQEYDQLERKLAALAPDHPSLSFVGTELATTTNKVEHATPMLSLQKVYEIEELMSWVEDRPVIGMLKVDGNSLSLVYEAGKLVVAKTRGNGRLGENVTDKAEWVSDVVKDLKEPIQVEIRGELYCTEHRFGELVDEMLALELDRPTSPRNIVAGMLGRKSHYHLSRFFNFFAFDVITDDVDFASEYDKFKWLEDRGFIVPHPSLLNTRSSIESYLEEVKKQMASGNIGLDGAVFALNDIELQKRLGSTSHHPRYKMSFKWQGDTATSAIESFLWQTSRHGVVTPVAVIAPVQLSGATITNVTLHNAEFLKNYHLKAGDIIEIVRSGEVIPKFLRVVKPTDGAHEWCDACPSCGSTLNFDGVRLSCPNALGCKAQAIGTIVNWIRFAEIEDLSEKRLTAMLDLNLVQEIPDLYRMTVDDFLKLPLTKEKMAQKLFSHIEKSKSISLPRFLGGLGVPGMGLTSWEKLVEAYPTLDEVLTLDPLKIAAIDGFAEKTAEVIVDTLISKKPLIDALLAAGVTPVTPKAADKDQDAVLSNKQIAITGKLSRPREELVDLIKSHGGKVASSVSKHTFAVVSDDPNSSSSKMKKARDLGVRILSEDEFMEKLSAKDF